VINSVDRNRFSEQEISVSGTAKYQKSKIATGAHVCAGQFKLPMSMTEIQRFGTSASLRRSAQVAFARKDTVGNPAAHPFVTWVLLVGILLPPI